MDIDRDMVIVSENWPNLRREEPASARNHGDEDIIALLDLAETVTEQVVEVGVEGVEFVGAVEGDEGDTALVGEFDEVFVCHFESMMNE